MIIKTLLLKGSIVVAVSLTIVYADANTVGKNNIGAGAGFVTGYGLSYRHWFNKNGIQATFAPYYSKDKNETDYSLSVGVTGLHTLKEAKYVNLLVYFGPHFWYNHQKGPMVHYDETTGYSDNFSEKFLFFGGGPGFDFHFWKMSFNLMFGLAGRTNFENNSGIQFTGEAGLYYSF